MREGGRERERGISDVSHENGYSMDYFSVTFLKCLSIAQSE